MTIKTFGIVEQEVMDQMTHFMEKSHAVFGVLCADNHLGYSLPVGGVVGLEKHISPNAVGFDIACGNKCVRLAVDADAVIQGLYRNMNEIQSKISFGMGRKNDEKVAHELFDDPIWNEIEFMGSLKDKAAFQLGTVGGGNHYVDLFLDERERVWIGVHFGSRGLGHTIATHFVKAGGGKDGIYADPVVFHEDSDLGQQYLRCMELAGRYAYAGRDWVCSRVAQILRGDIVESVHNHHNFAWKEKHRGRDLWVIRKGATPCFPGQKGFVGGSMGDLSVVLEGIEAPESESSLYSTVHGAGRVMGRNKAKGKRDRKTGRIISEGCIRREEMDKRMEGIELRGGDVDESPMCYKKIEEVLDLHKETFRICERFNPIGVCMADARNFDPYKD